MEMILLDKDLKEIGPVQMNADFEVGGASSLNDFELSAPDLQEAHGIYIPGTEWGGIIEYEDRAGSTTVKGWTWRGLLMQAIISPPAGQDYKTVSGEANTILRSILSDVLGGFFVVPETDSGLTINTYQFKLYTTVLEGLMDMLEEYGYRLKVYAKKDRPGGSVQVFCEAVPIAKLDGQYDADSGVKLRFTDNRMGINHLVCMGQGELQERQRIDLYMDSLGNVSKIQHYTGFLERTAYYDYTAAQSLEELEKNGKKRLLELASKKKLEITSISGAELEVGDIAVGCDRESGLIVEKPITKKILRITSGRASIEYEVKGEQ